jgi:superfamily II DNA/RNA helicase
MLEMGFQKDVETIIMNVKAPGEEARKKATASLSDDNDRWAIDDEDDMPVKGKSDRDVQMLLFSATMPGWICKLTDKHMIDPIFLDAVQEGDSRLAAEITHFAVPLPPVGDRFSSVVSCIEDLILTKGTNRTKQNATEHDVQRTVFAICLYSTTSYSIQFYACQS